MDSLSVIIHRVFNIILLFVIVCLLACIGDEEEDTNYYTREKEYDIKPISVEQVEMTEERKNLFSEYELDETYGKKVMYAIEMEVSNKDYEGLHSFEFDYIVVKSPEGDYLDNEMVEYYTYAEDGDDPYCEILPPYSTRKAIYYVVMYEDEIPEQLHIYKNYDSVEFLTIDMP